MTNLTDQQQQALKAIGDWYAANDMTRPFYLAGPAGTGKTTLAEEVGDALGIYDVEFGAYTGKAAAVLRSKGCTPANTLHSLCYVPNPTKDGMEFVWNPESELQDAALLILDEVSMVNEELALDLERYGVPILVLGDPEQLEPIGGEGYYTCRKPDFELTETHRFYIDGPVGRVATAVRESSNTKFGLTPGNYVKHSVDLAMEHDQILCWRNSTRWTAIEKIRARLGRKSGIPSRGDRIMCLTNNRKLGVFNGEQWTVDRAIRLGGGQDDPWALTLIDDDGQERTICTYSIGFTREGQESVKQYLGGRGLVMYATFAQAITVHKSQGSQYDSVYVVNESRALAQMTDSREGRAAALKAGRRWVYTAVTRAAEKVTITEPRG